MKKKIEDIKNDLIESLMKLENKEWSNVVLTIDFPPYINKGYSGTQLFTGADGNKIRLILKHNIELQEKLLDFIIDINKNGNCNQIVFSTERNSYQNSKIETLFNQAIEDEFQSNLPKSKRGKTIAWYL
jgi:hypothetical protein